MSINRALFLSFLFISGSALAEKSDSIELIDAAPINVKPAGGEYSELTKKEFNKSFTERTPVESENLTYFQKVESNFKKGYYELRGEAPTRQSEKK